MAERFDQAAYTAEYQKTKTVIKPIRLNYEHDADILRRLDEVGNMSGYVKRLIREDIKRNEGGHDNGTDHPECRV